ncbi:hypothetical protein OF83DRAFT_1179061 [Amylostereum chailletii]|nr:hypothetical protein OF83DRAFT_1179061 [Amylostereum chailletii]
MSRSTKSPMPIAVLPAIPHYLLPRRVKLGILCHKRRRMLSFNVDPSSHSQMVVHHLPAAGMSTEDIIQPTADLSIDDVFSDGDASMASISPQGSPGAHGRYRSPASSVSSRDESRLRTEVGVLMRVRDSHEQRLNDLTSELHTVKVAQEVMRGEIAEMRGEITEMRGEITEIRAEVAELKTQIDTRMDQMDAKINEVKATINTTVDAMGASIIAYLQTNIPSFA